MSMKVLHYILKFDFVSFCIWGTSKAYNVCYNLHIHHNNEISHDFHYTFVLQSIHVLYDLDSFKNKDI
jgi:hypothetical protein